MYALFRTSLVATLAFFASACGESGSQPDRFAEVQYRVQQDGGGTFSLLSFTSGGFQRRVNADTVYSTQGPIRFLVEGAPGPYSAEFCRRSGGELTVFFSSDSSNDGVVRLTFDSAGQPGVCRSPAIICTAAGPGAACLSDSDCGSGDVCEKKIAIEYDPSQSGVLQTPLPFADPDVRFEVCAPTSGDSCSVGGSVGDPPNTIFGRVMSGSVGDIESTYLVADETPAVYFLNSARHNVSAVFSALDDERLQIQLFITDRLRETESGTDDVLIRRDI